MILPKYKADIKLTEERYTWVSIEEYFLFKLTKNSVIEIKIHDDLRSVRKNMIR